MAYVHGSCDSKIDEICKEIPTASPTNRVLSLCVVDPFDFGIKFETLRRLSAHYIDFLVLLATGMDANRNYLHYVQGESPKIDEVLGNAAWRVNWRTAVKRSEFGPFLASEFSKSMESLRYLKQPLHRMRLVRNENNSPLYYLALFSRNSMAYTFWEDVLKYGTDQKSFWD